MLKVGIIGAGFMGETHSNVYASLPETQLVAVADVQVKKAEKLASSHRAKVYSDPEEMIREEGIDMVDVCLPTYLHCEYVVKAAEAGKHVLCEKPMAMNLDEANRMIEATERAGVKFMIAQCIRFWPEYMFLKQTLGEGTYGKLLSLSCHRLSPTPTWSWRNWLFDPRKSGSAALDLHIHDTDFIIYLLGKPKSVLSTGTKDKTGWTHIFTLYNYGAEVAVQAEGGWDFPSKFPFIMSFRALFEKGMIDFDFTRSETLLVYEGDKEPFPPEIPQPEVKGAEESVGNIAALGGYFNEIQYFVRCILEDKSPSVVTPRDSRASLEVTLAEIQSAEKGEVVELKSD